MKYFPLLLIVLLTACNIKVETNEPLLIDVSQYVITPKKYIVVKSSEEIVIDGYADEDAWGNAPFTDSFIDIEGVKDPTYNTRCKMVWDNHYFYVYAELEEPHIWGDLTEHDAIMYNNNDFEVFIRPYELQPSYGEIEINALGAVWELLMTAAYKDGGRPISEWDPKGMKSAVKMYGTVNDPSDIDSLWTVEMAIPMLALNILSRNHRKGPQEGEQWRVNFSRVQWQHDIIDGIYRRKQVDGKRLSESNWVWSNQTVINMHYPENWGYVQFTHKSVSDGVEFIPDLHLLTKQILYGVHRSIQLIDLDISELEPGKRNLLDVKYSSHSSMKVELIKTQLGYELKSPAQNNSFVVLNERGQLRIIE